MECKLDVMRWVVRSEKIRTATRTKWAMTEGAFIVRTPIKQQMRTARYSELRCILEGRRLEIIGQVQDKIRDVRADHAASLQQGVRDVDENSETDSQHDIEFTLLQMKAETLQKIADALSRLNEGTFGYCYECGEEISGQRLRALPFAVRCKNCEEASEAKVLREQPYSSGRGTLSLFSDHVN